MTIVARQEPPCEAATSGHSQALHADEQQYLAPGLQRIAQLAALTFVDGRGCHLTDADGREYLDFFAGVTVASLGHGHPRFVGAVIGQLSRLAVGSFTSEARLALVRLIASIAPGAIRRTQLYSGGAEAVEAAIRLARAYTGKFEIVGFSGGFHGKTGGVIGLAGPAIEQSLGPRDPGLRLLPYADCYRCPFQLHYPSCGLACLDFIRAELRAPSSGPIAAFVIEPMQGTAGNVIPPPEFLPGVQQIAREHDALLIADEMITGCARTGALFACEHTDTAPDIVTLGKGFGGGYPVSAVLSTDDVSAAAPVAKPSGASSSYGGNPVAAAAALATLTTIIDEGLAAHAAVVGDVLLDGLRALQAKYRCIGDVRGAGLFIGMDLVTERQTREPLPAAITEELFRRALRRGLLLMGYDARVRINPPLIISESEARSGVAILDAVFAEIAPMLE